MTDEQYQVLKKYEQQLTAAAKNNFLRLSSAEFNELAAVYDSLFRPLRPSQRNCNTCRINALKTLYGVYKEAAINAEKNQEEEAPENATEKPVESDKEGKQGFFSSIIKKKAGRPKKIDLEG